MALTIAQRQALLVDDLAASGADRHWIGDRIDLYWAQFADRDQVIPFLTEQYVKRRLAQVLLGPLRTLYDGSTADESLHEHQLIDTLQAVIAACSAEIVRLETKAARSRVGATGVMAAPAPLPYPVLPLRDARAVVVTPFDDHVLPTPPDGQ